MDRTEFLHTMIEDYRKKIEMYQAMIAEWERELGQQFSPSQPKHDVKSEETKTKPSSGADPLSLIREFQFWGKSQPEAAKALLELVGHPMKTEQILVGIEKGGVKVGGQSKQKKVTNFYTILGRSKDFATVARGTWGLTSWPGVTKKESDNESDEDSDVNATENIKP
jgi:hypothetical protein